MVQAGEGAVCNAEPRPVGALLMLGLIMLPIVFVWLLLASGYSRSLRIAAFTYTFAVPVLYIAVSCMHLLLSRT